MAFFFTEISKTLLDAPEKAIKYVHDTLHQVPLNIAGKKKGSIRNCAAEEIVCLALKKKLPQPKLASVETIQREWDLLSKALKKEYESKKACFLQAAGEALNTASLSVDEELESERYTYLEKQFKWVPQFTAVFTRRTNMSEYSLCIPGHLVRPSHVRQKVLPQVANPDLIYYKAPPIPKLPVMPSVKGIAKSLALALLKGTVSGGKVGGALVLDKILPPGTLDYFDSAYKEVEKIINQQLTQNTIDDVNGKMNSAVNWVKITYTNAKESQQLSTNELTALLQEKESKLETQMVGVLMSERYSESGICAFMIGAGMHLCVLQELAYVDVDADSPAESHFAETVQEYAKRYAQHATTTTESIMEKRSAKIVSGCYVTHSNGSTFDSLYYEDTSTGKKEVLVRWYDAKGAPNDADANRKRDRSMKNYRNEVLEKLKTDLGDPLATANEWLNLVDQPLPNLHKQ